MAHSIQILRRSILSKSQNLLHFLQIQHQFQNPNSIFTNLQTPHSCIQPQPRNYGSIAGLTRQSAFENKMIRLIRNEIQSTLDDSPVQQPPGECNGFKVEERPKERWITLSKKFGRNEEINIEVTLFDGSIPIPKEGNNSGIPGVHMHISMIISILKEESDQVLEFVCSAWPNSLEIGQFFTRERTVMPNKQPVMGPQFAHMDEELQESIYNFLEERGIDDNLCAYVHSYIRYKVHAEFLRWMEAVKSSVERK